MCMCCGLFVPTQFHFECCGVRDDMKKYKYSRYRYVNVYECALVYVYACVYLFVQVYVYVFRDFGSGLSLDLKDGEPCLGRAHAGGGSWRY